MPTSTRTRYRYEYPYWGPTRVIREPYPGHWGYMEARKASQLLREHDAERMGSAIATLTNLARADAREKPNSPVPDEVMKLIEEWPA